MQPAKATLIGQRSVQLVYAVWQPNTPRAVAVVVHGYGEHMGRYRHVIDALLAHNYVVYAIDHRGHGESRGPRSNVERFAYFVDDLRLLVDRAQEQHPNLPVVMIAHSLGGLIAFHYAVRFQHELAALVLSGAALTGGDEVPALVKRAASVLARIAPGLPLAPLVAGPESALSRDPTIQELWDTDPLTYKGRMKARMGHELLRAGALAWNHVGGIRLPVLIMHGSADRIVGVASSRRLYDQIGSDDKTLRIWDDCRHEIFNEIDKDEIIAFMLDWLDRRVVPDAGIATASDQQPVARNVMIDQP